jgi:hypothetical protein
MHDVNHLLGLARRCRDLEKTAIESEVVEQLRIWATELAEMAEMAELFSTKWLNNRSWNKQGACKRTQ